MSTLTEDLEKLVAELEGMEFTDDVCLKVTDIHDKFADVLTPEAALALEPVIKATIGTSYRGTPAVEVVYTRAVYLSVVARSAEGIAKAGRLIYEEVNKLAAAGLLRGHLCRLSMLRLADTPGDLYEYKLGPGKPATAIFCFPHVPMETKVEGPYFTEEGGTPVDLEPELKPAILGKTSLIEKVQSEAAAKRIEAMEKCCPANPCFADECGKCSAGPRG